MGGQGGHHDGTVMEVHKQLVCFKPRMESTKPHMQYDLCTKVRITDDTDPTQWDYTIVRVRDKATNKMMKGEWRFDDKCIVADITGIYYQCDVIELD